MDNYLDRIKQQRQDESIASEAERKHKELLDNQTRTTEALIKATIGHQPKVTVKNADYAKTKDIERVEKAVKATDHYQDTKKTLNEITRLTAELVKSVQQLNGKNYETNIELRQDEVVASIGVLANALEKARQTIKIEQDKETAKQLKEIKMVLKKLEVNPQVTVEPSTIDTKKLEQLVEKKLPDIIGKKLEQAVKKMPMPSFDLTGLVEAVESSNERTHQILSEILNKPYPVPEYPVFPTVISDETGERVLAIANADGSLITGGTSSTPTDTDNLLLESGDALLLENGDQLLLESA